ncbi:MAG TPA: hypothetical protein VEC35_24965 [Noviherbaspirillum sp.]|nr:hypothetical protein [Noviherbaspirillum sp.]
MAVNQREARGPASASCPECLRQHSTMLFQIGSVPMRLRRDPSTESRHPSLSKPRVWPQSRAKRRIIFKAALVFLPVARSLPFKRQTDFLIR